MSQCVNNYTAPNENINLHTSCDIERRCKTCSIIKNINEDFYSHNRNTCKKCLAIRQTGYRKTQRNTDNKEVYCKICKLDLGKDCFEISTRTGLIKDICNYCKSKTTLTSVEDISEYRSLKIWILLQKFDIYKMKLLTRVYRDLDNYGLEQDISSVNTEYNLFRQWALAQKSTPLRINILAKAFTDLYISQN